MHGSSGVLMHLAWGSACQQTAAELPCNISKPALRQEEHALAAEQG